MTDTNTYDNLHNKCFCFIKLYTLDIHSIQETIRLVLGRSRSIFAKTADNYYSMIMKYLYEVKPSRQHIAYFYDSDSRCINTNRHTL